MTMYHSSLSVFMTNNMPSGAKSMHTKHLATKCTYYSR